MHSLQVVHRAESILVDPHGRDAAVLVVPGLRSPGAEVAAQPAGVGAAVSVVGHPQGGALHVMLPNLNYWDTLRRHVERPFPDGHVLTCFRAKGGLETPELLIEWAERLGSIPYEVVCAVGPRVPRRYLGAC